MVRPQVGLGDCFQSAEVGHIGGLMVRSGAALDEGAWQETEWHLIEPDSLLGIEWQRGHPLARDGHLYLSVDGRLTAWLTDLDNDAQHLGATGMTQSGARTLLIPKTP